MSVPEKQKERYLTFQDDYLNFVGEYPESSHRKELDSLYNKVKEK
jgi:outer membrane protein assembly factor BamD